LIASTAFKARPFYRIGSFKSKPFELMWGHVIIPTSLLLLFYFAEMLATPNLDLFRPDFCMQLSLDYYLSIRNIYSV